MEFKLKIRKLEESKIIIKKNINFLSEIKKLKPDRVIIITDKNVYNSIKTKINFAPVVFLNPQREKNFDDIKKLLNIFYQNKLTRRSVVVAAGGGKITDITGFASSIWLRGIKWVAIPTTLLSQIDACLGGKTAIDFNEKNLIGSFHNPSLILIDPLIPLTRKQNINESKGEIIKYILISPKRISEQIQNIFETNNLKEIEKLITLCITYKSKIVKKDPFDIKGIREILNFGHTIAHPLEKLYKIPHGNAVTIGIKYALILSKEVGILNLKNYHVFFKITLMDDFKIKLKKNDFNKVLKMLERDKKNAGYKNYFLLINNSRKIKGFQNIELTKLKKSWRALCQIYS